MCVCVKLTDVATSDHAEGGKYVGRRRPTVVATPCGVVVRTRKTAARDLRLWVKRKSRTGPGDHSQTHARNATPYAIG